MPEWICKLEGAGLGSRTMTQAKASLESNPVIEVYKKDVDRTLLREALTWTWDQRAKNLMALLRAAEAFEQAGSRLRDRPRR
jgi:hypothetical protein